MESQKLTASVIIPAHNAEAYIAKAVGSALAQSFAPLEVLVSCDGCTDKTAEVARSAGAIVLENPKSNGAVARNVAAKVAKGDVLFFLDADDWWETGKIAAHMQRWEAHKVSFVLDRSTAIYETGAKAYWMGGLEREGLVTWEDMLGHKSWPSGSGFSVSKANYRAINGFNEKLAKWQDVDFWVRAAHQIGPGWNINESFTNYLLVTGSVGKSTKNLDINIANLMESWSFLSERDKAKFKRYAYLQAAEFTPFPKSWGLFRHAGFQLKNRYYWKCLLSSLRRGVMSNMLGRTN